MEFTKTKNVRFSHCDPAGIVFYPRYAELCNEVVEDWFREGLGIDFHELHERLRLAIPAVRLEIEFMVPSSYGDVLDFTLRVAEIGNSSFVLMLTAAAGGQERVRIRLKVVLMSMNTMRSVRLDEAWRERLAGYRDAQARL
jgi:4-hydroxybenzoyl-CoA thioesterase